MIRRILVGTLVWLSFGLSGPANAATGCRVVSAGGVAFGSYDELSGGPTDTLLALTVACDRDGGPQTVSVEMGLGPGLHAPSASARRMLNSGSAGEYLSYGLYRNIGRSSQWGTTSGVDTVVQTISVPNKGTSSTTFTIYGRMPSGQNPAVGSYSDSIQVTVQP